MLCFSGFELHYSRWVPLNKTKQANAGIERVAIFFSFHLWPGYLGYVQRIRPGKTLSVEDFNGGDLIEGYLDYLKVSIRLVLKRNTF